jgi:hypothetical protein
MRPRLSGAWREAHRRPATPSFVGVAASIENRLSGRYIVPSHGRRYIVPSHGGRYIVPSHGGRYIVRSRSGRDVAPSHGGRYIVPSQRNRRQAQRPDCRRARHHRMWVELLATSH